MRCLNCHYSLKALTEHRCPECGWRFDPANRSTYRGELESTTKAWLWSLAVAFVFVLAAIGLAVWRFLAWMEHIASC